MKNLMMTSLATFVSASLLAAPEITNVAVAQDPLTHVVTVSYDLNEDAIVTVAFLTNGVVCETSKAVAGDVWRLVKVTGELKKGSTTEYMSYPHRKLSWNVAAALGETNLAKYSLAARVTAWSKDSPPTYYVLDLATGSKRFYECEGQLPLGIGSDVYRTTQMVFRRIPAAGATFKMGSPKAEWDMLDQKASSIGLETQHNVSFTKDFYMGVFEVTQAQWSRVYGSLPTQGYTGADAALCPVANVGTWNHIRCNEGDCGSWPQDGRYPQNTHFLGKLRKLAGGTEITYPNHTQWKAVTGCGYDVPLEAQWEFACRAGTTTAFNNGRDVTDTTEDSELGKIAWYKSNSDGHVHPVGTRKSNAWGLYDMHGNVTEWIRDSVEKQATGDAWYKQDRTDPEGIETYQGTRGKRGGNYNEIAFYCRSAIRNVNDWGGATGASIGFRVSCPVDEL